MLLTLTKHSRRKTDGYKKAQQTQKKYRGLVKPTNGLPLHNKIVFVNVYNIFTAFVAALLFYLV